jgi:hypothetical protein
MTLRPGAGLTLALLTSLAGCGTGDGPGTVVRDSAGVTIVENNPARPAWGADGWRIAEAPLLVVGGEESPVGYTTVRGITHTQLLPSGELVVADGEGPQILIFGPDGEFRRSVGRSGDGPGEFRSPYFSYGHRGDSLVVFNLYRSALVYDSEGRFGRNFVPGGVEGETQGVPKGVFGDGTLLFMQYQMERQPPPGLGRNEVELVRVDLAGGLVQRFGMYAEQTTNYGSRQRYLYGPWGHMTAGPDAIWYSPGDRIDVQRIGLADSSLRFIRMSLPSRPVSAADVTAEKEALLERYRGRPEAAGIDRMYADVITAPVFPAHGELRVDDANHLWVAEYRTWVDRAETPWHVFNAEGHYLGQVVMPSGFYPHQIVGDRVVGRHTDAEGLETARVYRIDGRTGRP